EAQLQKIPYMLVIGDNEAKDRCLTVRLRDGSNFNNISIDIFLGVLLSSIQKRDLELCQFS
nr:His/Gly/Thr/Pro-type tRNA ligase C-terminal domain-containing protein [Pseudobdellovibrionaceae bacterium]